MRLKLAPVGQMVLYRAYQGKSVSVGTRQTPNEYSIARELESIVTENDPFQRKRIRHWSGLFQRMVESEGNYNA